MLAPKVRSADTSIVRLPPKQADPFYLSAEWRATRQRVLERDGFRCTVEGCGRLAVVCDHILARRQGGADDDGNLRSLCRLHDNRIKEDTAGNRRSQGRWGEGV